MGDIIHDPTFWVLVAFVIFVIAVYKPIRGAMLGGLDSRIAEIRQEVEEAEKLREEAQSLLAKYQRQQRQALQDAENIVARARESAERHRAEAEESMKEMVRRQEEQAREKIAQAEATAIQQVRAMSVDLAMAAAEKLLVERLGGTEGSRLIDASIQDIPRKLQ
ncbi:MAG: ATP F0F1 synthase subunit B [Rickettsiales bacterium]|jgi:F-type H+-transporting ATPase subunit b